MTVEFDFSKFNSKGFMVLPPGQYPVKITDWYYREKEETGNKVNDIDIVFTDGEYKGETRRHWQTVTSNDKSVGAFMRMLSNLGLIKDEDRDKDGKLKVSLKFGDTDDKGRAKVVAIIVNGEERPVKDASAIAVIVNEKDDSGELRDSVDRLDAPKSKKSNSNTL